MTQPESERRADRGAERAQLDADTPSIAYARCEHQIARLLRAHLQDQAALQALVSGIMTHAQEYALVMARLYLQSRGQSDLSAESLMTRPGESSADSR